MGDRKWEEEERNTKGRRGQGVVFLYLQEKRREGDKTAPQDDTKGVIL